MKHLVLVAAVPAVPTLWLLAQAGSNAPGPVSLPFDNVGQVWIAVITLAGAIFTNWMGSRREARNRAWQVEDRKAADLKAEKDAKGVRDELLEEAMRIRNEAWSRADGLKEQLNENTTLTRVLAGGVALPGGQQVPVKVTPMPDRRPGDSAPKVGRRESDPPPAEPTRRAEDKP